MKVGMCMLLWTTHVTRERGALLRDIKAAGFDGVEIPVFEGSVDHFADLGDLLDEIGLQRTAIAAMGDPAMNLIGDDAARRAGIAHMAWALDCTRALGATILAGPLHSTLGHFSGAGPTQDERRRAAAAQRAIGDQAAERGVTVALEALNRFECYLVNTMEGLSDLLDQIDHPHIKAMYDTFHCNIEEQDPVAAYTDFRRHVVHVHLSENDRGVPGRGHVPWQQTFRAIRSSGYDDWLTIEAFGRGLPDLAAATKVWRDFAETPEAVYRDGIAHIRQGWDAAG